MVSEALSYFEDRRHLNGYNCAVPGRGRRESSTPWLTWLLLLLLVGSVYFFWILPFQLPDRPVKAEFVPPSSDAKR